MPEYGAGVKRGIYVKAITASLMALLLLSMPSHVYAQQVKGSYVDEVRFIHYLDENVATNEVRAGNLDTYFWRLPLDLAQSLKDDPSIRIYDTPGGSLSLLINPAPADGTLNPFSIREVRYAMNYLIDRDLVVNEVLKGFGAPMYSAFGQFDPDYIVLIDVIESFGFRYNPALASDMVSEALTDAGASKRADGKWYYNDKPIQVKFFIRGDDPRRKTLGEILASDLEKMGFTVERIYGDLNKAFSEVYGSDPREQRWHLYTEGWGRSAFTRYDTSLAAQMYAPWFANMPGFQNNAFWNYENKELDDLTQRIFTGKYASKDERDSLLRRSVDIGVRESVRIFIASTIDPYVVRKGVDGMIQDFGAGITGRFSLINAKTDTGVLKVGMKQIYQGSWNPVAGLRDWYATRVSSAIIDPATFFNPHTGDVIPVRATWKVDTRGPDGALDVPSNALVWDPYAEQWRQVGDGIKAKSKVTLDLKYSKWHNGVMMDRSDILYSVYFLFEWGTREGENDATYDPEYTSTAEKVVSTFKGIRFLDEDTVEVYVDYWHFDPNYIADYASVWASMPWEIYAAMERVVMDGKAAFSRSQANAKNVPWLSLIIADDANLIKDALNQFRSSNSIPSALKDMVSSSDADSRYSASIDWIDARRHAMISNGPFYLEGYNPEARTIVIKAFRDPTYPFEQGRWRVFEQPMLAKISSVDAPLTIERGKEAVITGSVRLEGGGGSGIDPSRDVSIYYFMKDANGNVVVDGSIRPSSDGRFEIRLAGNDTGRLSRGTNELKVFAVSDLALRPDVYATSIIGTGEFIGSIKLTASSTTGKYRIAIDWYPSDVGSESRFDVRIMDGEGRIISDAKYDLILVKDGEMLDTIRKNATGIQSYVLGAQGNYTMIVDNINGEGERAEVTFTYVPEFPMAYVTLFIAVTLTLALLLSLRRSMHLNGTGM
ncbi:MAG: ABC transporter substrate-binding protein [Candidatus Nitrosocaldus sp.]|nr:ABC transporter substrate-binding protein [Candidatus Nitrosocaldus sp.]MDW8275567.1 ABC transporter substrate-binding protein [Candidatus Nitrosocaldus sp.]